MIFKRYLQGFVLGIAVCMSTAAVAQEDQKLMYLVKDFSELRTLPGFSYTAPSGFVPGRGVGFASISGSLIGTTVDGAYSIGFGHGDPFKGIGGAVSLGIGSVDPTDGGAFSRGNMSISLGHIYTKHNIGISTGLSGIDLWNDGNNILNPSAYITATKLFANEKHPVALTAGFGNNGFVDIDEATNREDKLGVFFSSAVYVIPQVSLIADYSSGITSFATGIAPFPDYPISFTFGVNGAFGEYTDDEAKLFGTVSTAFPFMI